MDNTLLVSLSHQIASYRSMDVIANNLANLSTPAFKRESVQFGEVMLNVSPKEGDKGSAQLSFVTDRGVVRDLNDGRLDKTGAPFDVAITGRGYFAVQTAAGERYTRNGHFVLNAESQITTADGNPVLGDGGPVTITPEDGDVAIAADGTISGKNGNIGRLRLVQFANERGMTKEGASLYASAEAPAPATRAMLTQGMIESSNVEPVLEISHMIEVMRAYQATATLTQSQEDLMRQAISKLGATPN